MAKLAIRGHATRGREVIEILEMFGGENKDSLDGINTKRRYFIGHDSSISIYNDFLSDDCITLTLEEFLEKFPYKVGDKLLLNNGDVVKITNVYWDSISVVYEAESTLTFREYDNINAEQLQPYVQQSKEKDMNVPETMKQITDAAEAFVASTSQEGFRISVEDIVDESAIVFRKEASNKTELVLGDDFEVVVEDGKTYVVRKQPKFPTTVEDCLKVMGLTMNSLCNMTGYKSSLLMRLQQLLICRDAYWKLAGDWKPIYEDDEQDKWGILKKDSDGCQYSVSTSFAFPTEDMRDAFFENFKELIEGCKELL